MAYRLICEDNLTPGIWQDHITERSVRLLLTDPPYGKKYQSGRRKEALPKMRGDGSPTEAAANLCRVLLNMDKAGSFSEDSCALLCFCDQRSLGAFRATIGAAGWEVVQFLIWKKARHGSGDLRHTFAPQHELILFARRGRTKPRVEPRIPDVLASRGERQRSSKDHPAMKPVPLLKRLIHSLTRPGDLVVDPYMGSGSSGVAAVEVGRSFFGVEVDEAWFSEAKRKVDGASLDESFAPSIRASDLDDPRVGEKGRKIKMPRKRLVVSFK